jgi:hypothetical protein
MSGQEFLYWAEVIGMTVAGVAATALIVTVIRVLLWRLAK